MIREKCRFRCTECGAVHTLSMTYAEMLALEYTQELHDGQPVSIIDTHAACARGRCPSVRIHESDFPAPYVNLPSLRKKRDHWVHDHRNVPTGRDHDEIVAKKRAQAAGS